MSFVRVFSAQYVGLSGRMVAVEVALGDRGVGTFRIVGLPDKAVEEARERIDAALKNSNLPYPSKHSRQLTVSLSPADMKKTGTLFDLPIAVAYLQTQGVLSVPRHHAFFIGELSLSGELLPVRGVLPLVQTAKSEGFRAVFVPEQNAAEAALVSGIRVYPVADIAALVAHFTGKKPLTPAPKTAITYRRSSQSVVLDDVVGQSLAKRALVIAAAGGHNVALYGPPGTGKTLLAKSLAALLPPLDPESVLTVTAIHSLTKPQAEPITTPPFRAPHHSASYAAIVGGGSEVLPGEITRAHRGVLFLDEFPEFDRRVINSLRQPLEDGEITIARAKETLRFPARFILAVALNPCPCGWWGTDRCHCSAHEVKRYQQKISGPIADRIDLWVSVHAVPYRELQQKPHTDFPEHRAAQEAVAQARARQATRFGSAERLNAGMSARGIRHHIRLTDRQQQLLEQSAERLRLSPRGYHRVLKVARTIADLEGSMEIADAHLLEALTYRQMLG